MARLVRRRFLIPGPVLIGFNELFDRSYGDPNTPRTADGGYPKITPARIGHALLPFVCIYCNAVKPEMVDPRTTDHYRDIERRFSWCPSCRGRYVLDRKGTQLEEDLPADADFAPALVERNEEVTVVGHYHDGLNSFGVIDA